MATKSNNLSEALRELQRRAESGRRLPSVEAAPDLESLVINLNGEKTIIVAGPRGEDGPIGAKGAAGERGQVGREGEIGPMGLTGAPGRIGNIGSSGERGIPGLFGPPGPTGLAGEQGEVGPPGSQGEPGPMGSRGSTGPQGKAGPRGEQGIQGLMGTPGVEGPTGHIGPEGKRGLKGEKGIIGPQGPVGPPIPEIDKEELIRELRRRLPIGGFGGIVTSVAGGVRVYDEALQLGSDSVPEIGFVGAGVTASRVGDRATITIPGGGVTDANYLVGTAHAGLSAAIVVGTTPGGELGGTWATPTVDAAHGGTHAIGQGGTGQTTAQLAINALSAVGAATVEHVLTKDTATGNAKFKAAVAGGSPEVTLLAWLSIGGGI